LERAASLRPNDARVLVNLGNALLLKGDEAGALAQYQSAAQADPMLAAAPWNLSRALFRRAPKEGSNAEDLDRAKTAEAEAERLSPSLLARAELPDEKQLANLLLLSPELAESDLAVLAQTPGAKEGASRQVADGIWKSDSALQSLELGGGLAALAMVLGALATVLRPAQLCDKCGRCACLRCDPELKPHAHLCFQCVQVFTHNGRDVPPPMKVQKQLEASRNRIHRERIAYALGLLCSGAGHVFLGRPLKGAAYAFCFVGLALALANPGGWVNDPYGTFGPRAWLLPVGLSLAVVYLLSLRDLRRSV
jgi:tetratricopeptide (TPR) repeat protein